ncbi:hypothetical protein B0J18DRAFT_415271 [Chaetomium sp. MPI-SDFR-AT-0129]|nr:hypothetical protein B0J18DRAFT_415271 [Chaetomium sp. MPI-SDFR-AT-0129]
MTMESIQLAQMLADLNELSTAESQAAVKVVTVNKANSSPAPVDADKPAEQLQRPALRGSGGSGASGGSSFISRTASPAKFDKYGRRILTPPNTRSNSTYGSIPGTPKPEADDDVSQASSLMALYEIRAKLKDHDTNRNLSKLREKIDALHAKQLQTDKKDGDASKMKIPYPKKS